MSAAELKIKTEMEILNLALEISKHLNINIEETHDEDSKYYKKPSKISKSTQKIERV